MNLFPTRHRPHKRHQQGQAMVEYAILFLVLSILFIGGAELGMAALASYKNTDAAKTGISEYAEVNQRRLNILNAERQYLSALAGYDCRVVYEILNVYDDDQESLNPNPGYLIPPVPPATEPTKINITREMLFADEYNYTCTRPNQEILNAGILITHLADNFQDFLDTVIVDPNLFTNRRDAILTKYIDSSCPNYTGSGSETNWNSNSLDDDDCTIIEDELNLVTPANQSEGQDKFKALLLISHIKLSKLPLDSSRPLSQATIVVGDHASDLIQPPNCNGGIFHDGLPDNRYIYREYNDNTGKRHIYQSGSVVYLFNPLPINIVSCQTITGGVPKLVGGYTPPQSSINSVEDFENNFVAGLPKLNQAMYGMYKNDLNGNLIPPGKMCVSDDTNVCPDQNLISDNIGPTGFFRWNKGSDSNQAFRYTISNVDADLQNFRPSMQIECNASPTPNLSSISSCNYSYSKVRLHTRYRKIFEGFLGFGVRAIDVNDDDYETAVSLFYNPNNGSLNGQVNGVIDSEIGPRGNNGKLSVKQFKDFRGCYEVDVETNQVSACN